MMLGEATKRTACSVSRSVDDSTTWVREKRRSVILHANPYKQHRDINKSINNQFKSQSTLERNCIFATSSDYLTQCRGPYAC